MKLKIGDKKTLIKILEKNGFYMDGGTKHEKWTDGQQTVFVPRHSKNFSRMCAERILKTIKINLQSA
jgi:predicted RNA binding protein YcfA (HicA-like mRNA interferase family)